MGRKKAAGDTSTGVLKTTTSQVQHYSSGAVRRQQQSWRPSAHRTKRKMRQARQNWITTVFISIRGFPERTTAGSGRLEYEKAFKLVLFSPTSEPKTSSNFSPVSACTSRHTLRLPVLPPAVQNDETIFASESSRSRYDTRRFEKSPKHQGRPTSQTHHVEATTLAKLTARPTAHASYQEQA